MYSEITFVSYIILLFTQVLYSHLSSISQGFDFHDFTWITEGDVRSHCKDNKTHINILLEYIHENATAVIEAKETVKEAAEFYDENDEQKERAAQRLGK